MNHQIFKEVRTFCQAKSGACALPLGAQRKRNSGDKDPLFVPFGKDSAALRFLAAFLTNMRTWRHQPILQLHVLPPRLPQMKHHGPDRLLLVSDTACCPIWAVRYLILQVLFLTFCDPAYDVFRTLAHTLVDTKWHYQIIRSFSLFSM